MFNLGAGEVLVILLLALIVLGPQRLPEAAKQVGRFTGEIKRLSSGFQQEMKDALRRRVRSLGPRPRVPPPRPRRQPLRRWATSPASDADDDRERRRPRVAAVKAAIPMKAGPKKKAPR